LALPVEVVHVLFEYTEAQVELCDAGTTVTVVETFPLVELEIALFDTPHCGLYWYWPVPSTMSWIP
jgi:hypothetical protein